MGFWSWFKENITDGLTEFVFAIGLFFVTAFATAIEVSNYGLLGLLFFGKVSQMEVLLK